MLYPRVRVHAAFSITVYALSLRALSMPSNRFGRFLEAGDAGGPGVVVEALCVEVLAEHR